MPARVPSRVGKLTHHSQPLHLEPADRRFLVDYYRSSIELLESDLNRDRSPCLT